MTNISLNTSPTNYKTNNSSGLSDTLEGSHVGLSDNKTNLTTRERAHYVEIKRIKALDKARLIIKPKDRLQSFYGDKSGVEILQYKPNYRAIPKIFNGIDYLTRISKQLSMVTLVYGKDYPSDKIARNHLSHFRKRVNTKLKSRKFQFVWVIEPQQRGAPHFHIITPNYINKDWLNEVWNDIVNKWQGAEHLETQEVYPNVERVRKSKNSKTYLTKGGSSLYTYITKGTDVRPIEGKIYGMDTITSSKIKEETVLIECESDTEANDILIDLQSKHQDYGVEVKIHKDRLENGILRLYSLGIVRRYLKAQTISINGRGWVRKKRLTKEQNNTLISLCEP